MDQELTCGGLKLKLHDQGILLEKESALSQLPWSIINMLLGLLLLGLFFYCLYVRQQFPWYTSAGLLACLFIGSCFCLRWARSALAMALPSTTEMQNFEESIIVLRRTLGFKRTYTFHRPARLIIRPCKGPRGRWGFQLFLKDHQTERALNPPVAVCTTKRDVFAIAMDASRFIGSAIELTRPAKENLPDPQWNRKPEAPKPPLVPFDPFR